MTTEKTEGTRAHADWLRKLAASEKIGLHPNDCAKLNAIADSHAALESAIFYQKRTMPGE